MACVFGIIAANHVFVCNRFCKTIIIRKMMELDVKLWLWALPSKVVCYRMVSAGSCSWNDSGVLVLNELNFLNFFFFGKRMLMYSEKVMAPLKKEHFRAGVWNQMALGSRITGKPAGLWKL